jgi:hypothetical protein
MCSVTKATSYQWYVLRPNSFLTFCRISLASSQYLHFLGIKTLCFLTKVIHLRLDWIILIQINRYFGTITGGARFICYVICKRHDNFIQSYIYFFSPNLEFYVIITYITIKTKKRSFQAHRIG